MLLAVVELNQKEELRAYQTSPNSPKEISTQTRKILLFKPNEGYLCTVTLKEKHWEDVFKSNLVEIKLN